MRRHQLRRRVQVLLDEGRQAGAHREDRKNRSAVVFTCHPPPQTAGGGENPFFLSSDAAAEIFVLGGAPYSVSDSFESP